ncbi:hypothetical protein K469DRAFT_702458 [Zopfia rhizophila CBS 207.26]|uniref:Uncharacterized protein n=1 Tax=Zopfia rhizophila CBS 207.26 TaxID=1314779 RepID=A0A6A6ECJ6_9PEZI|nr:hypothetical protein K469DRAFT_702458 [Zopfia rhizophila CBS 207.26]
MCDRDIIPITYANCTASPKHEHSPKIVLRPCATHCGTWKDNHLAQTTERRQNCPKC